MGNLIINPFAEKKITKLSSEVLNDNEDFMIVINVYTTQKFNTTEQTKIIEYFEYMNPYFTYIHNNLIYLIFRPSCKSPFIRSCSLEELISYIASELSIWLIKNTERDPRMVSVNIYSSPYKTLITEVVEQIKINKYKGRINNQTEPIDETTLNKLCG